MDLRSLLRRQMRVITYGTFDLFHEGHRKLLERAKSLGSHLIVGVTTENFDDARGKLNVQQSLMERIQNVQASGLADQVIIEEYEGQKIHDMQKYGVDIFAIGSDWRGSFDYLQDYCQVIYLDRTEGISSTLLRKENLGVVRLGIVGAGRIANRFMTESLFVSGVHIEGVCSRTHESASSFKNKHQLKYATTNYADLLENVDAVYLASPHETHFEYAEAAIRRGIHVLCEKPLTLTAAEAVALFDLAREMNVVLVEALKTAFSPGFQRMVAVARSGSIGDIRSVDATFTKLEKGDLRELQGGAGGSISELASYPVLAIVKLLGGSYRSLTCYSHIPRTSEVDLFSRIDLLYPHALASARVGLGVKCEGDLVVGGTEGYIYVPAPWWKTEYFEARFEDPTRNKRYYYKFDGDGLRYEIAEFISLINGGQIETYKMRASESIAIARIIETARQEAVVFV
ncbi:Gfo/Idh/MocA family oxidoreductase [Arthrobacter ipis]|uniref:Gfo/Idh/MocA family oxidoreductase n=1 Tax=Arthrobacter ipis TaxID=2716202 RepID=UPI00288BAEF2|nr:Gfo/Idh/MocA family oxidoreductase [Arthrobacter ipis]